MAMQLLNQPKRINENQAIMVQYVCIAAFKMLYLSKQKKQCQV